MDYIEIKCCPNISNLREIRPDIKGLYFYVFCSTNPKVRGSIPLGRANKIKDPQKVGIS